MNKPADPWSRIVRLRDAARTSESFDLRPEPEVRAALAERLGISSVRKLRFTGRLEPQGRRDWRLEAELGATVVQPCGVTLAPVTTRIDEPVVRRYMADAPESPEEGEVEMPDETVEPLPASVDLGAVMTEALALALPPYPRADDAASGDAVFAGPGTTPMTDEEARPFAQLRRMLNRGEGEG